MPKRYKEARLHKKLKLTEAAELLGVSQSALSSWESERKAPSVESLEFMADTYGVTTDYLLGRDTGAELLATKAVPQQILPIMHAKPVWVKNNGWGLVDASDNIIIFTDRTHLAFSQTEAVLIPDRFEETTIPMNKPLTREEIAKKQQVWVEPISKDTELREQLRGWYWYRGNFVEDERGLRFSLSAYSASWLAFGSNK